MSRPYNEILAKQQTILWGDKYARTMAQALFSRGLHETPAAFQGYIRKTPFGGSYIMTGGQNIVAEWMRDQWKVTPEVLDYLREEVGFNPMTGKNEPLYTKEFLKWYKKAPLQLTIEAMPEGSLAFPDEPIYRVTGSIAQCLLIETPCSNSTNSQSLFATLASRIVYAGGDKPVTDNGLRRCHSIGGLAESRASFLGGFAGTSNDQAAMYYKLPSYGTMAHAYVMFFDTEIEAFRSYMQSMPHNCTLLIDTYDSAKGIDNAITVALEQGVRIGDVKIQSPLKSIREDSGDLAEKASRWRQRLDAAGLTDSKIVVSNNLDEFKMDQIENTSGKVNIWAVGTRAATTDIDPGSGIIAPSQASLGAVYKLVAVAKDLDVVAFNQLVSDVRAGRMALAPNVMTDKIKLSSDPAKTTLQGMQSVVRILDEDNMLQASVLTPYLEASPIDPATGRLTRDLVSVNRRDPSRVDVYKAGTKAYDPHRPMVTFGQFAPTETIHEGKARGFEQLKTLSAAHRRLINPATFDVGVEQGLYQRQQAMIRAIKGQQPA